MWASKPARTSRTPSASLSRWPSSRPTLVRKLEVSRDFYERKKRSIFEDIWREEVRTATRLVYENNGFAVFCPYASRTPFELAVYPKRQCADFHGISDQEVQQLADALKTSLGKLAGALNHPPYHLMLYTAPTRTARRDHWNTLLADFRWHIEMVPALYYTSGFETATGCHLNPVFPETAAAYLRKIRSANVEISKHRLDEFPSQ